MERFKLDDDHQQRAAQRNDRLRAKVEADDRIDDRTAQQRRASFLKSAAILSERDRDFLYGLALQRKPWSEKQAKWVRDIEERNRRDDHSDFRAFVAHQKKLGRW